MLRVLAAALFCATAACVEVTASETAEATVSLKPKAANTVCMRASPDPVSIRANQGVSFANSSSASLTVMLSESNTPLVTVDPGQTSGAIKFSTPGTRQYYIQGCGSASAELHRITVTVN